MIDFDSSITMTNFGLNGATAFVRLRAREEISPYNPAQKTYDWNAPDRLSFYGALSSSASSSTSRTPTDLLSIMTTSTATLTVADPLIDICVGDRIQSVPDDGRIWEVTGIPSRDVNAFSGWRPTAEITLTEWKG